MWWLIPIGIGILVKAVYDSATEEEVLARREWESKKDEVKQKVVDHRKALEEHLKSAKQKCDFHELTNVHFSSMMVGNLAHANLKNAQSSLDGIGKMLISAKEKRDVLYKQIFEEKNDNKRKLLNEEFDCIGELRASLFNDKDKIKAQRDEIKDELKRINQQTHELKVLIKDRCGSKGLEWYNKIEAKKLMPNKRCS